MGALFSTAFSRYDPKRDIPDLTGKVAIVTGAKCVFIFVFYYSLCYLHMESAYMLRGERSVRRWNERMN